MFIKAAEDLCINGVQYKTNQCKKNNSTAEWCNNKQVTFKSLFLRFLRTD
jgi:hypothetical protein